MDSFSARCIFFNIDTKEEKEVTVFSVEDIRSLFESKDKVTQINIDKYHKVYYDASRISEGISSWCSVYETYDSETGFWEDCIGKDFILGNNVLLVLCDDTKPIDITEESKEFMISCLKI